MEGLIAVGALVTPLILLDVLALLWGHDSRDDIRSDQAQRWQLWWEEAERRPGRIAAMFDPDPIGLYASYRQDELVREAARERLLRAARLRRAPAVREPWKITAWIGARMVRLGCRLQACDAAPAPGCSQAVRQSHDTAAAACTPSPAK